MEPEEILVDDARAGQTVSAVVREHLDLPWSRAKKLCTTGRVWVDGVRCTDVGMRLRSGQRVRVAPGATKLKGGTLPREAIAHVDADVVVVRKPAGMLTVPYEPTDKDTLVDRALAALRPEQKGSLGVVQRLDKDTTGLVVFARNLAAKRHLQGQFRQHTIERRYLAIAHGEPRPATHDTLLVQNRGDGLRGSWGRFRAATGTPPRSARQAITHVRVLEELRGAALLECRLETGRQHQIRIHLSEAGSPLVGERVYIRDYDGPAVDAPRPMLHAIHLSFTHPRTGRRISLDDPPPPDFEATLQRLRA